MIPFIIATDFSIVSQHVCGPTEEIRKAVIERFAETESELIFSNERAAMMLHRGESTWTISMQFANNTTCRIVVGTEWPVAKKS